MDYSNSQHPQQRRSSSTHLVEEDLAALEEVALGSTSPQLSPDMKIRRGSLPDHASSFSTSEAASWHNFPYSMEGCAVGSPSNASPGFLLPSSTTAFTSAASSQGASFSPQASWPPTTASGSCTPTPGYEQVVDHHQNRSSVFGQHAPPGTQLASYNALPLHSPPGFHSGGGLPPTSPQSSKGGWMSTSSPDGPELKSMPSNSHPHSPPNFVGITQILRRDGIRKKNARFEIPAERNLRTIDQLINQTSDEQEIKELKQQKRLLRNRQAALDSRQRKKQHTERLEEEKKHYTSMIGELEEALSNMRVHEADWMRAKEQWDASARQYQHYIDTLLMEKEELVRQHTIETCELRKRNSILMEQIQRMDQTAMSTAPSSTGFSADYSDYEHLTMNNWEDFPIPSEFSIEAESRREDAMSNVPKPESVKNTSQDDKAATSGLLLMLLLCGAWVASRTSNSSLESLPTIPEEMKAASAAVLDNIYRDSGVQLYCQPSSRQGGGGVTTSMQNLAHNNPKTTLSAFEIASLSKSPLESLHHRLVTPSEQQVREQAFSLTPAQYNDLSTGIPDTAPPEASSTRTLGEIFSTTSLQPVEGDLAQSYAKSLMRDRVSTQVLKTLRGWLLRRTMPSRMIGNQNLLIERAQ